MHYFCFFLQWMQSSASTPKPASTRSEYLADEASAFRLHDEQPDQDDEGERQHGGATRRIEPQAFQGVARREMAALMAPAP